MSKFKLDENLPPGLVMNLRAAGYDATSVLDEGLSGSTDADLLAKCRAESRVLITLDLDFSDIRAYPPDQHQGIIVLRPVSQSVPDIRNLISKLATVLETEPVQHRLWIMEETRLRIRGGT